MARRSSSGWWPPPSKPRPAVGIRARSTRGAIGATWWSRRFVDLLESFNIGARLQRGRTYARGGQVLNLTVESAVVEARVQGSRVRPYRITIELATLSPSEWDRVEAAMVERAVFLARLLAGEMPPEIEEVFAAHAIALFPASRRDLVWDCSCPDWGDPCKHVAAVLLILAEAFDRDPFLVFRWRGRSRDELLASLRQRRGANVGTGPTRPGATAWPAILPAPPLAQTLKTFWTAGDALARIERHALTMIAADALLLQIDTELELDGMSVATLLAPAYAAMSDAMRRRLAGDATHPDEPTDVNQLGTPPAKRRSAPLRARAGRRSG
ncbi:MAG TPA: SWIM zinc finger family protein [Candidatus Acidoferrales bacterium]|nr:SWIM zinc finger family protein [Candidatus Acidoferrales bacterium]